jgi:hypothetical protein
VYPLANGFPAHITILAIPLTFCEKENTNVLSYYVIKTILLNNYPGFLFWCKKNNTSLLQFKKTLSNQTLFCKFISNNYKKSSMLEGVDSSQKFLNNLYLKDKKMYEKYVLTNLMV